MKNNLVPPHVRANDIADAALEVEWRKTGPYGNPFGVAAETYRQVLAEMQHTADPRPVIEILGIKDKPAIA